VDGISFLVHFDALTVLVLQQLSSTIQLPVRFSFGRNRQKDKQGRQTDRQTDRDLFNRLFFQDNVGKPAPERSNHLDFNEERCGQVAVAISWTTWK